VNGANVDPANAPDGAAAAGSTSPPRGPANAEGGAAFLWTGEAPLLLASTSAARRALLQAAGVPVETEASGVDEREIETAAAGLAPPALALRLAQAKALAVSRRRPDRLVLGADQVLDFAGEALHKPADRAAAQRQLARLAGRSHRLHSACALARGGAILAAFTASATLTMRALGPDAIERYLDVVGEAALWGAGSYQVEGLGIHLFASIEGDQSTILGLPLIPLLERLRGLGLLAF
jgi:septum formation protein